MVEKYNGVIIQKSLFGKRIDLYENKGEFDKRYNELTLGIGIFYSKWDEKPKAISKLVKMMDGEINDPRAKNN